MTPSKTFSCSQPAAAGVGLRRFLAAFMCGVGILASIMVSAQEPAFLRNGLVAYYPFNGNGEDASGNGHGQSVATEVREAGSTGPYFSNAIQFPVKASTFPIDRVFSRTIAFWLKVKRYDTQWHGRTVALFGGTPLNYIYVDLAGRLIVDNGRAGIEYQTQIPKDVWTFVAIATDSQDLRDLSIYINGVLVDSGGTVVAGSEPYGLRQEGNGIWLPSFASLYFMDQYRFYSRRLSDVELKTLYDYESVQQAANPRVATATAQVVNGFVVGATVTDGGSGYTNAPSVTFSGGGGSGATARATVVDGMVTAITILNPGIGYASTPGVQIAPPPFPPRKASGSAEVVNGFVVGATVTDGGFGYDAAPVVLLSGGGGTGAAAVATVANGVVTGISITNPGSGYTSAPLVKFASPPFSPRLGVAVSKVRVTLDLVLGRRYRLEASSDMQGWNPTGPDFVAQDEQLVQEFDSDTVGRFFRVRQVP